MPTVLKPTKAGMPNIPKAATPPKPAPASPPPKPVTPKEGGYETCRRDGVVGFLATGLMVLGARSPLASLDASSLGLSTSRSLIHASKPAMHRLCSVSSVCEWLLRYSRRSRDVSLRFPVSGVCDRPCRGCGVACIARTALEPGQQQEDHTGSIHAGARVATLSEHVPLKTAFHGMRALWGARAGAFITWVAKGAPSHDHEWSVPIVPLHSVTGLHE